MRRFPADKSGMGWIVLMLVAMVVATVSARFMLAAAMETTARIPDGRYNVMAMRVSRWYRIISWGFVTLMMVATLFQISVFVYKEIF